MTEISHFSRILHTFLRHFDFYFTCFLEVLENMGFHAKSGRHIFRGNILQIRLKLRYQKTRNSQKVRNSMNYGGFPKEPGLHFSQELFSGFAPGACFLTLCQNDSIFYVQNQKCSRNFARKSRHHWIPSLRTLPFSPESQNLREKCIIFYAQIGFDHTFAAVGRQCACNWPFSRKVDADRRCAK